MPMATCPVSDRTDFFVFFFFFGVFFLEFFFLRHPNMETSKERIGGYGNVTNRGNSISAKT